MFRDLGNNFFSSTTFGLNISDHFLKFAKIIPSKGSLKLSKYGEKKIPSGVIEFGKIKNQEKLEEILSSLKKEENLRRVRVSLPIGAMRENIMDDYISAFNNAGIKILSFEFEPESLARILIRKNDPETHMIIDFGEKNTGIYIISNQIVMSASNLNLGGRDLSTILQEKLNITFEEAEKIKKEQGLEGSIKNKEIFPLLLDGISALHKEIEKNFLHWHLDKDEENKNPIQKIIFCGGSSNLKGLSEYFSTRMKHKSEMGNVWINILNEKKNIQELNFKDSLSFAVALGLALGDFDPDFY